MSIKMSYRYLLWASRRVGKTKICGKIEKFRKIFVFYLVVPKKVFNFAAQKERQFIQLNDNKPLRRAERQHTRGALLILGSNEIHRDTLLPKFILYLMVSANRYYHITRIGIRLR